MILFFMERYVGKEDNLSKWITQQSFKLALLQGLRARFASKNLQMNIVAFSVTQTREGGLSILSWLQLLDL